MISPSLSLSGPSGGGGGGGTDLGLAAASTTEAAGGDGPVAMSAEATVLTGPSWDWGQVAPIGPHKPDSECAASESMTGGPSQLAGRPPLLQ